MGAADGVLVIGHDGRVLVYNSPAESLLGLPAGALAIGTPLREVVRAPGLLAAIEDRLRADKPSREHVIEIGPDRTVNVELALLPGEDGVAPALLVLIGDARDAERLQSMRRDFLANVSHEVRTPLAAIRACSATLLAGAVDDRERARQFVTIIDQHAARLGQLVDDLGCLADLEHGDVALHRRVLAVTPVVETAVRGRRPQALAGGVALEVSIEPDVPPLDADRDLLEQALLRLIDNALRFTPPGGRVTISAGRAAAPDGAAETWVRLAVTDNGIGVPAEDVPRLSERFYRPDKGRSRELGGSGLGLALVKHIVRAHGGTMEIASAPKQGTAVTLVWPSRTEPVPQAAQGGTP